MIQVRFIFLAKNINATYPVSGMYPQGEYKNANSPHACAWALIRRYAAENLQSVEDLASRNIADIAEDLAQRR